MNTRKYSSKQEKRVAKDIGGKVTSNSGATRFYKGDISTDSMLIECKTKTTTSKSVSIKKEWLGKLKEERFAMGKSYSSLAFDFGDGEDYFIIDKKLMQILIEKLKEN